MLMHEEAQALIIIKCLLVPPLIDKITVNSRDDIVTNDFLPSAHLW